jgi:hypothetical protein
MRMQIAAVLYPVFEVLLFGVGTVAAAVFPATPDPLTTLVRCALAATVLAAPLAWQAVPLLLSERELRRIEGE